MNFDDIMLTEINQSEKDLSVCVCVCMRVSTPSCSVMSNFATLWTTAHQASLPTGLFRQEYRSGLPFPTPGDLPNLGIKLVSLASSALASGFFTNEPPGRPPKAHRVVKLTD